MNTGLINTTTKKLGGIITRNSPTILTGISVAGLLTTTIMAVKATPKALEILNERREEERDIDGDFIDFSKMGIVKETWKFYIPTAISGALTIVCIISANSINLKRNAAIAGLYSLSEKALSEYQSKVIETIGEKKHKVIKDSIAKDRITKNPVREENVVLTGHGETLCYDALGGRYFRSDIEFIRRTLSDLNYKLVSEMYLTLNEVYYALDLTGTKLGEMVGWDIGVGQLKPEFSSQLTENDTPCLVLDFTINPKYTKNGWGE